MTADAWLLLALVALGLLDLAVIAVGWIADRHLTTTTRKDSC
ncbi:hypothetical protein [Streptomyces nitrosporeus]